MTNKTKPTDKKEPFLTPDQWKLGLGVLALMVGVMADAFISATIYNGIAIAMGFDMLVLAVLAVFLFDRGEKEP